mmetsp:Transcript_53382/g.139120  ORF Transcript_53382/g.139120 Transcript_53382/m.139120 type:complete len:224 (+) Transcript_53382:991-1662(+)
MHLLMACDQGSMEVCVAAISGCWHRRGEGRGGLEEERSATRAQTPCAVAYASRRRGTQHHQTLRQSASHGLDARLAIELQNSLLHPLPHDLQALQLHAQRGLPRQVPRRVAAARGAAAKPPREQNDHRQRREHGHGSADQDHAAHQGGAPPGRRLLLPAGTGGALPAAGAAGGVARGGAGGGRRRRPPVVRRRGGGRGRDRRGCGRGRGHDGRCGPDVRQGGT